jgi:hypothetical protein
MQIKIIEMLVQRRRSTLREKKGKTMLIVAFRRSKEETTRIMTQ